MDNVKIKIALDTGCLNVKREHPFLNKLDQLEKKGIISLSTSSTSRREQMETQSLSYWQKKYLGRIDELEEKYEPTIIGISRLGMSKIAKNGTKDKIDEITSICFPGKTFSQLTKNQMNDILHLVTAIDTEADFFLTKDKKDMIINGKREKLEKFGIKIREPNEKFLKEIDEN